MTTFVSRITKYTNEWKRQGSHNINSIRQCLTIKRLAQAGKHRKRKETTNPVQDKGNNIILFILTVTLPIPAVVFTNYSAGARRDCSMTGRHNWRVSQELRQEVDMVVDLTRPSEFLFTDINFAMDHWYLLEPGSRRRTTSPGVRERVALSHLVQVA